MVTLQRSIQLSSEHVLSHWSHEWLSPTRQLKLLFECGHFLANKVYDLSGTNGVSVRLVWPMDLMLKGLLKTWVGAYG
jgi:hypothetical protein